jgi:uncharacterized protein (DUF1778 family)
MVSIQVKSRKSGRLEARVTDEQKSRIQRAADLSGRTLTDFAVSALMEVAERTIREHEVMVLSERDSRVVFDALFNPPEPNEALLRAARRYRELVSD